MYIIFFQAKLKFSIKQILFKTKLWTHSIFVHSVGSSLGKRRVFKMSEFLNHLVAEILTKCRKGVDFPTMIRDLLQDILFSSIFLGNSLTEFDETGIQMRFLKSNCDFASNVSLQEKKQQEMKLIKSLVHWDISAHYYNTWNLKIDGYLRWYFSDIKHFLSKLFWWNVFLLYTSSSIWHGMKLNYE